MNDKKNVHFSVDDVINCFLWLKKSKSKSLFDSKILNFCRYVHEIYGIGTTLNCMYFNEKRESLFEVPSYWKNEFESNKNWLKLSFHCYAPHSNYMDASGFTFKNEYVATVKELERFAGKCVNNSILRLHYFQGNSLVVDELLKSHN